MKHGMCSVIYIYFARGSDFPIHTKVITVSKHTTALALIIFLLSPSSPDSNKSLRLAPDHRVAVTQAATLLFHIFPPICTNNGRDTVVHLAIDLKVRIFSPSSSCMFSLKDDLKGFMTCQNQALSTLHD
ncbi:hypothetical protein BsWGS_27345 [Bradybaena similaris]